MSEIKLKRKIGLGPHCFRMPKSQKNLTVRAGEIIFLDPIILKDHIKDYDLYDPPAPIVVNVPKVVDDQNGGFDLIVSGKKINDIPLKKKRGRPRKMA